MRRRIKAKTPVRHDEVQYATPAPWLPRWRLRRWAQHAMVAARADGCAPFMRLQLTLRLVDEAEGRALNRDFRGRDAATNVLTLLAHAAHLSIHGVLHALGYDHDAPDEAQRMEALETRILAAMGVADPYQAPGIR